MDRFVSQAVLLGNRINVAAFVWSETASRLKINNNLPERCLANARRVVALAEAAEVLIGAEFLLLSGYRTPALSVAVGGKKNSFHTFGLAVDGIFRGVPVLDACRAMAESNLSFGEIEAKQTQLHFTFDAARSRKLFVQRVAGGPVVRVFSFPADGFEELNRIA